MVKYLHAMEDLIFFSFLLFSSEIVYAQARTG